MPRFSNELASAGKEMQTAAGAAVRATTNARVRAALEEETSRADEKAQAGHESGCEELHGLPSAEEAEGASDVGLLAPEGSARARPQQPGKVAKPPSAAGAHDVNASADA